MKKKRLTMLIVSALAHMTIAGTLMYVPFQFSMNGQAERIDRVIWGQIQVAGNSQESGVRRQKSEVRIQNSEVRSQKSEEIQVSEQGPEVMSQNVVAALNPLNQVQGQGSPRPKSGVRSQESEEMQVSEQGPEVRSQHGNQNQEVFYSHQEDFQSGMSVGCSESNYCIDGGESEGHSGTDTIASHRGDGTDDPLRGILEEIRREIEKCKYYPPFARVNGIEGTVYINFHVGNDGSPGSIAIGKSSGSKILDESAIRALKTIKRFSSLPEEIRELDITVPIAYRLTEERKR